MNKNKTNWVAVLTMMFLFGMISFVTNLAAPIGVIWKQAPGIDGSSFWGMMGNMMNFLAYLFMGIPAGKLITNHGYKKTTLIGVGVGFCGVLVQFLSGKIGVGSTLAGLPANFFVYLLGAFICGFSVCILNTVVNYTAHGFHFYKGAPFKNWLLYYPVEKICAHFTDVLITINKEDYALAQKKMKPKKVEYVPGVGIDVSKFADAVVDRDAKRDEIGVPRDAFVLLSVGELNGNKNHETVIKALAEINNPEIHYVIAGRGRKKDYLENLAEEKGVKLHLLGFRRDIPELDKVADVFVFPSYREGLSVSVMEAMASGLPIVCSRIRGNTDLVNENGGFLFDPMSIVECREAIEKIRLSNVASMGKYNYSVANEYEVRAINTHMKEIYRLRK